jgi:hypothetical protein
VIEKFKLKDDEPTPVEKKDLSKMNFFRANSIRQSEPFFDLQP